MKVEATPSSPLPSKSLRICSSIGKRIRCWRSSGSSLFAPLRSDADLSAIFGPDFKILEQNGIECQVSGKDSPMNVSSFRYIYAFENGGFGIYSGNYLFHPPGQGAFVVGFKAFRWLLNQLGIKQPRRFKNENAAE